MRAAICSTADTASSGAAGSCPCGPDSPNTSGRGPLNENWAGSSTREGEGLDGLGGGVGARDSAGGTLRAPLNENMGPEPGRCLGELIIDNLD